VTSPNTVAHALALVQERGAMLANDIDAASEAPLREH